jgi:NAD(P)H-nitrite reductase large subunit
MRTLVIGAGMAAMRLVEQLVARGVTGLTVVGGERHAPYNRILLPAVLEGTHRPEALGLRTEPWFAAHGVALRLGVRAARIDRPARVVELADGTALPYDRLVLATGSRAVLPPIQGLVGVDARLHPAVYAFRSLDDCARLADAAPTARRAVVVGGGLLGLQVARALSVRGLDTEIVEGGEHLLAGRVDATAGALLHRSLARLGTRVYTGVRVVRLTGPTGPTGVGVHLDNGFVLDTDLVVLAAGARPAVDLAHATGIGVRRGIVVDEQLRTADPQVYAVGDCAEPGGRRASGFVAAAWEQAQVLAAHLAGVRVAYRGTRTVARLRATDLEVAVLGEPEQAEGAVVAVTNPLKGTYRKLVVRDGAVVAGALVGDLSRLGVIGKAFEHGTVLGRHEPGALLLPESNPASSPDLPDDAEVCACAGVSAGRVRACSSLDDVRRTTRATTGCGGCAAVVSQLLRQPELVTGP